MDYGFNDRFVRAEERIANQKIGQYLERSTERQKEGKTKETGSYTGDIMRMPNMVHWSLKRRSRKE